MKRRQREKKLEEAEEKRKAKKEIRKASYAERQAKRSDITSEDRVAPVVVLAGEETHTPSPVIEVYVAHSSNTQESESPSVQTEIASNGSAHGQEVAPTGRESLRNMVMQHAQGYETRDAHQAIIADTSIDFRELAESIRSAEMMRDSNFYHLTNPERR